MHADIGLGILLSLALTSIFGVPITYIHVLVGIIFTLLPDIDLLSLRLSVFKKLFKGHRNWTHYPLIYVPIVATLLFIAGPLWALMLLGGVLLHLLHDSLWIGSGIKWGWPFSKKTYKFFNQERPYEPGPITWIQEFYLRPTVVSVTETAVFVTAVIALFVYTR